MDDISKLMQSLVDVTEQRDAAYDLLQTVFDDLQGHEHGDRIIKRVEADIKLLLNEAGL